MGTVGYMSPEQVRGEEADHRSDIFSLGTVLYEMLSGRRLFAGNTSVETMSAIINQDPPELPSADVPPSLERIVRRCLEKSAEERFQSARDLVTIHDPQSYTRPFSIRYSQTFVTDSDNMEYICTKNGEDRAPGISINALF
jgi:serine/threonine protein kinase